MAGSTSAPGVVDARGMASTHELAATIGREQDGLALRSQLRDAGISDRTIRRWLQRERWSLRLPGVIDLRTHQPTWWQSARALLLAAGPDAVLSHATAAVLHGLLDVRRPAVPDVLVPRGRHAAIGGHRLHTTVRLPDEEVTCIDGWPATAAGRCIVDMAPQRTDDWLQVAIGDALRRGVTDLAAVVDSALARRGAPATGRVLRACAGLPPNLDRTESPLEVRGLIALARIGLVPPRVQYPIVLEGKRYRFDIAWPTLRVAGEFDGATWHEPGIRRARDARKDGSAGRAGWVIERLRARDVNDPWSSSRMQRLRSLVL